MKIKLQLLSAFIFLVCNVYAQQTYYVKSANGLNLRRGPGQNHQVVTSIPNNQEVEVISQNKSGWWKIEYGDYEGYTSSSYLSKTAGGTPEKASEQASAQKETSHSKDEASRQSSYAAGSSGNQEEEPEEDDDEASSSGGGGRTPNAGLGIRLGEPSGLTLKGYFSSRNAIEFSVGRSNYYVDHNYEYYNDRYYDEYDRYYYDNPYRRPYRAYAVSVFFHYLRQHAFNESFEDANLDGLYWYAGMGPQLIIEKFVYDHDRTEEPDELTIINAGIDLVIGMEYTFEDLPLSAFVDVTFYFELQDQPMRFIPQAALGARYNF